METTTPPPAPEGPESPEPPLQERLASGTLVQQGGQLVALIAGLAIATAIGRSLSLAEFGVYGLVISFSTYLYFALGSAENAAVTTIAAATDQRARNRTYSTAVVVYAAMGLVAGTVIAAGGVLLLGAFGFRPHLVHEGRLGVVALGAVTAVGWPLKLHQDLLRASHRWGAASSAEIIGNTVVALAVLALVLVFDAPLWALIAVAGSLPFAVGLAAVAVVRTTRAPYHFDRSELSRSESRAFLRLSASMMFISASDLFINSLDRTILAAFRSAASLGLYEAAARLNNFVRAFTGSFSVTLLPVLSTLGATDDVERTRALLVRGTRYMLIAVVPPTVTGMVLGDRILASWLGERYASAGGAAAIFLAWWLLSPNTSVPSSMLIVNRHLRRMTVFSWSIAAINLALSLVLTPLLGLEGVAIGTTAAYVAVMPFFMAYAFDRLPVTARDLAREAWLPAYGAGALLAATLGGIRLAGVSLDTLPEVFGLAAAGVLGSWLGIYLLAFDASERDLVLRILRLRRGPG